MAREVLPQKKAWSRPAVTRLGKIQDVAGGPGLSTNNKTTVKT